MTDEIKGTWEEVIQRNEQEQRDFELRVVRSQYRELHLWKDEHVFAIGKGTAASTERWYIHMPVGFQYGDSLEEVLRVAEEVYPEIRSWLPEFNEH